MENYDYVITKPELNEDTLAHYGVKGMKWRHKKGRTKESLRSNRPRSRKRHITGKGTGGFVKKTNSYAEIDQLAKARTDEERRALTTASVNKILKGISNDKVKNTDFTSTQVENASKRTEELKNILKRKKHVGSYNHR